MSFVAEPEMFVKYSEVEEISLREYQHLSIDGLRANIRNGMLTQILASMVGSGKTVMAAYLLHECWKRGRRGAFVVDRLSLLGQTSDVLDRYGIPHGVIQSGHPRYRPHELIQVCSIQTVAKRGWPQTDLVIIDEAHVLYDSHKARIRNNDGAVIIGLSATPFTKGLGKFFQGIVNVTTGNKLTEDKFLVPFKVWAAAEPDMSKCKPVAGEWTDKDAREQAMPIIGDVVREYEKHGNGGKAIVFGVDVAHCEELQRQALAAGIRAELYTYRTGDEERDIMLREFRKPDSSIRWLISVAALSRGFDVPDVSVIAMCRPLKSSFAEFVQILGRGLRSHPGKESCIAKGQRVLCQRGLVPIDKVLLSDKVWDGNSFVTHGGAVCKGVQEVITHCGLTATPDHKVKTRKGWRSFGECAAEQIPIVQTGLGRQAIRERQNYFAASGMAWKKMAAEGARAFQMRDMRKGVNSTTGNSNSRIVEGVPGVQSSGAVSEMDLPASARHEGQMHESQQFEVFRLWWQGREVRVFFRKRVCSLDSGEPWSSSRQENADRSNRQRGELRTGESSMVNSISESEQHAQKQVCRSLSLISTQSSRDKVCGPNAKAPNDDDVGQGYYSSVSQTVRQTKREVWDILNCGPRNCFTVENLLVHNCTILDLAGNFMRHYPALVDFMADGVNVLCDGKPKAKEAKQAREKKPPVKCPACKFLPVVGTCCPSCGYIFPPKTGYNHAEGELGEFSALPVAKKKALTMQEKATLYGELKYIGISKGYAPGWAANKFREFLGVWPNLFKGEPPRPPSAETLAQVAESQKKWSKSKAGNAWRKKTAPVKQRPLADLFA